MTTRLLKSSENINGLPIGFQEVEYLASDGNQWIDTGYTMTDGKSSTFEGTMMWTASQGNANFFYGYRSVNSAEYQGDMRAFFIYGASPAGRLAIRYGVDTENSTSVAVTLNKIFNMSFDGTDLKVDGTTYVTHTQSYTPANYRSMWLFNCNCTGYYSTDVNHFIGRIYRWKMFQDGTAVRDFIPALNPAGRPCMYDLVGKKAYYNLGSGEFSYGRKIIPVEYLESSGQGQYIETGITANFNTKAETLFSYSESSGSPGVLGGRTSSTSGAFCIWGKSNAGYVCCNFSNTGVFNSNVTASTDTKYTAILESSGYTVNGSKTAITTTTTFTSPELYLFDVQGANTSTSGTGNRKLVGRIYYAKLWDNNTLVRDFIPCIDENNTPYMFDKVTHTCYLNAGTGTFNYGKKLYSSKVRLYKDSGVKFGDVLPKGLKRVEYLENTGTGSARNWISTGIVPDNTTRWEVRIAFNNTSTGKLMGCGYTNPNRFNLGIESSRFRFAFNGWFNANPDIITPDTNIHTWVMDAPSKTFTIDGYSTTTTQTFGTSTFPIALFGRCNSGNGNTETSNAVIGKIYYSKIWQNNVLVSDMVPVLDNDGIPCMYDKVSGELFYNKGTGQFTYGSIIPNKVRLPQSTEIRFPKGYTEVEYLESTGEQYIDTGYKPIPATTKFEFYFSPTNVSGNYFLFGARPDTSAISQYTCTTYFASGGRVRQDWAGLGSYFTAINVGDKALYSAYNNTVSLNNESVTGTNVRSTDRLDYNFLLFTVNTGGTADSRRYIGRVYYSKIWDNDKLVHYFIPALDPNGKPCMWDVVTKQPFYNQGTGEFSYGREIQPVEYLESTGTQYISTDYKPNTNTRTVGRVRFNSFVSSNADYIFGVFSSPNNYGLNIGSARQYFNVPWGSNAGVQLNGLIPQLNTNYEFDISKTGYLINGQSYGTISTESVNSTRNMYLFWSNGTSASGMNGRIYYLKIYDDGALVRNFVPAIDSNNVGFMFDRVTHTIFDNKGTGSFTYGSSVPNKLRD